MGDIRYAIRSLRKQPVFTSIAVLTLTLGIGANTAIFSLLYRVLLRPLPYRDADRLVFVWNTYPLIGLPQASVSIPDYIDRKTQAPAFEDATLFTMRSVNLTTQGQPEQLRALAVTPSFFTTLGRRPFIGRGFQDDEAQPGADNYAILTYATWTSHFGADPSIVGRDIRLNGESHRVTGVLAADFELPATEIAVLQPFAFTAEQMADAGRGNEFSQMIARLQPGATIEQANAQMKTIVNRNLERLPARRAFAVSSEGTHLLSGDPTGASGHGARREERRRSEVAGLTSPVGGDRHRSRAADHRRPDDGRMAGAVLEGRRSPMLLLALFGGVALVLSAIGIYGVLAFAVAQRTREIGIRQALGADRRSILSLLMKQGTSTAAIGVGLGLAGSIALTRYLQALLFGVGAHDVEVYVAVTVLLLSVATAACYVPARRATAVDPNQALRDG
jgi:hypothetical protein